MRGGEKMFGLDWGEFPEFRKDVQRVNDVNTKKLSDVADNILKVRMDEENKKKLHQEKIQEEEEKKVELSNSDVFDVSISKPVQSVQKKTFHLPKRVSMTKLLKQKKVEASASEIFMPDANNKQDVIMEVDTRELERQKDAQFIGRCFYELRTRLINNHPFDRTIPPAVLPRSRRGKIWTTDMIIDKLRKDPDDHAETTRAVYIRTDRVIMSELEHIERKPLEFLKYINELGCMKGRTKYNTTKSRLAVLYPDIWAKIKDYVPPFSYYEKARANDGRELGYEMHPARSIPLNLETIMIIGKNLTGYNSMVADLERLTGCRTAEVPSLLVSSLFDDKLLLTITGKKHSEDRRIILSREESSELYNHLNGCLEVGDRSPFSDLNIGSYRVDHLRVRYALGMTGDELRRYAPHSLRHTVITNLRKQGAGERDIQHYIGQRDKKSTMQYGC